MHLDLLDVGDHGPVDERAQAGERFETQHSGRWQRCRGGDRGRGRRVGRRLGFDRPERSMTDQQNHAQNDDDQAKQKASSLDGSLPITPAASREALLSRPTI